jgi:predicted SprT family Zn-dependent metalloprotease
VIFLSSITKSWTEEDFRKELRRLDQLVKQSQGIELVGAELDIEFSQAKRTYGMYYPNGPKFKFSLFFFNSNVPEACAIDVIRHEYAHYYAHAVFGTCAHDSHFKTACRIVGAMPRRCYSKEFEKMAREKEAREMVVYESTVKIGQKVRHPFFREGVVVSVEIKKNTALLTVDFGALGRKVLDEIWLKNNGLI